MTTATPRIRAILPPGGFANAIGVHLAALDHGLEEVKVRARKVAPDRFHAKLTPETRSPAELLLHIAEVEGKWLHQGIGGVPASPPPPPASASRDALFAHLDAVRKASAAILRPLVERDLDTLRAIPGKDGKTTVRRTLVELLEHQAHHRGQIGMLARLLGGAPPKP